MQKHNPLMELPRPSPYMAVPVQIQIGDTVCYRGHRMKVWSILNLTVALHPEQVPGIFYVLKGEGMHPHAYFIVPANDIERPQTMVA